MPLYSDLNIQDKTGDTALHVAAEMNQAEAASYLIQCGAKRDIQNHLFMAPLHVAVNKSSVEAIEVRAMINCTKKHRFT